MLGLGIPEMVLILIVALLIFGPKKLPEIGRSVGSAMREFKKGVNDMKESFDNVLPEEEKAPGFGTSSPASMGEPVPAGAAAAAATPVATPVATSAATPAATPVTAPVTAPTQVVGSEEPQQMPPAQTPTAKQAAPAHQSDGPEGK